MRASLICLAIVVQTATAQARPQPSVGQLLKAEAQADLKCRGSNDDTTDACSRRDRLVGRLSQSGWCWGKLGQIEAQKEWHRCDDQSIYINDVAAPKP